MIKDIHSAEAVRNWLRQHTNLSSVSIKAIESAVEDKKLELVCLEMVEPFDSAGKGAWRGVQVPDWEYIVFGGQWACQICLQGYRKGTSRWTPKGKKTKKIWMCGQCAKELSGRVSLTYLQHPKNRW